MILPVSVPHSLFLQKQKIDVKTAVHLYSVNDVHDIGWIKLALILACSKPKSNFGLELMS